MIIDMHTHTFPDKIAARALSGMERAIIEQRGYEVKIKAEGTTKALSESTEKNHIDMSVIVPVATKPQQSESINRFAQMTNEKSKENHLFSLGAIHPDNTDYKRILDDVKAMGLKGIKIHPDYQKTMFDDDRYLRIMDYAANLNLIIVTHAGEDVGLPGKIHCTPDSVLNILKHIQPDKLVLAHMGGWNMWDEVEEKLVGKNIYFDTAFCFEKVAPSIGQLQFERIVKTHGADRILFATDSPWSDQGDTLKTIKNMNFNEETIKKILGENAKKLLDL